jgi:Protein of unknown function (DUF2971)
MSEHQQAADAAIWRYMDLERFVIMLVSNSVRFTKAAHFHDDPWEGFCKVLLPSNPLPAPDDQGVVRLETWDELKSAIAKSSSEYLTAAHEHLYVSSWSLSSDSMAMWKIYGSNGRGLAIKSSVQRFKMALHFGLSEDHFEFGPVRYVHNIASSPAIQEDFTSGAPFPGPDLHRSVISKAFVKRDAYQHENEWRCALYQDGRPGITGLDIQCDLLELIESIILGPYTPEFMVEIIQDLMGRFAIDKTVLRSNLLVPPPGR